jgi:hypothetical protein
MAILEFNELAVGQQVGVQTTDRGVISGVGVTNGGSSTLGFTDIEVADDTNLTFNGDGSAGAIQIFPLTIVRCRTIEAARTWKFDDVAITSCFFVGLNIEGVDPGAVTINDQDDVALAIINTTFPDGTINNMMGPTLYFDTLSGVWRLLRNRILVP